MFKLSCWNPNFFLKTGKLSSIFHLPKSFPVSPAAGQIPASTSVMGHLVAVDGVGVWKASDGVKRQHAEEATLHFGHLQGPHCMTTLSQQSPDFALFLASTGCVLQWLMSVGRYQAVTITCHHCCLPISPLCASPLIVLLPVLCGDPTSGQSTHQQPGQQAPSFPLCLWLGWHHRNY